MNKSKFLKVTSTMLIATSGIMAFISLVMFVIFIVLSRFEHDDNESLYYFMRYLSINPITVSMGCIINIAAAGLGIFSGIYGIKNWNLQRQAAVNMVLGISTCLLTLLGFVLIIAGVHLFGFLFLGWLFFQLATPLLHAVGAYCFKIGKPIRMSSKPAFPQCQWDEQYQNSSREPYASDYENQKADQGGWEDYSYNNDNYSNPDNYGNNQDNYGWDSNNYGNNQDNYSYDDYRSYHSAGSGSYSSDYQQTINENYTPPQNCRAENSYSYNGEVDYRRPYSDENTTY